jgi:hypothetical protein
MVVTVKEARMRIEELEKEYEEFLKLQNYAMCMDLTKPGESTYADSLEKDKRREMLEGIRKEVNITSDLRTMFSFGCILCRSEIERINDIIENQKVNI